MQALSGIKILDLTRVLAGPFCTQMLADLGAEVVKVESLQGDDTRRWGPPFREGESAYYLSTNRGKQSLAVDLKDPRGADLVRRMAARADVLIENFKVGGLRRFGLDYPALRALNLRLVYASITGFGQTGPRAAEPGYDVVLEALTGIMSVTGPVDGEPSKVGVAWLDLLTGLTAAVGILAALRERGASGKGQYIDLALFDVGVMAMANQAQSYLMTGVAPRRWGNAHPQIVPYQTFRAADDWFMLAVGNDDQYRRMVHAAGHPELWNDPRFRTNAGRVAAREELVARLRDILAGEPREVWMQRFRDAGVPAAPVLGIGDAFGDAQALARNVKWSVAHPTLGDTDVVADPLQHMSRTPARAGSAPPRLGADTRSVLARWLGLDQAEIDRLLDAGVVRAQS
ncbi:MAG: CaiB/BaiF CoA transferase family protein [Rhodanobacteraceae bacterium]